MARTIRWLRGRTNSNVFIDGTGNRLVFRQPWLDSPVTSLYFEHGDDEPIKTFELPCDAQKFANQWLQPEDR